jgi:organic hydroperoxide reductase OsmC/OhrA
MSRYEATISWQRAEGESFVDDRYSRAHLWTFDGGLEVPASASPDIVPLPHSVATNVDPEEAFVAALSSCHMLWFLAIASKRKYTVEHYTDRAWGVMENNAEGKLAMTRVTLCPQVSFAGEKVPDEEQYARLHHLAHDNCFIANSVKTSVDVDLQARGT